ncbi:MAG: hypothetical protein IJ991_12560, partial [Thermoguttaceae bacterium]|nr:hypothetical protein [Thermoguttaceae bacterium]
SFQALWKRSTPIFRPNPYLATIVGKMAPNLDARSGRSSDKKLKPSGCGGAANGSSRFFDVFRLWRGVEAFFGVFWRFGAPGLLDDGLFFIQ